MQEYLIIASGSEPERAIARVWEKDENAAYSLWEIENPGKRGELELVYCIAASEFERKDLPVFGQPPSQAESSYWLITYAFHGGDIMRFGVVKGDLADWFIENKSFVLVHSLRITEEQYNKLKG